MRRIGAHYLYINPDVLLKNGVVEIDDKNIVTDYFSLNDIDVESSKTEFYTGFLAPAFVDITIHQLWKMQQNFPNSNIIDFIKSTSASIEKGKQVEIWLVENLNLVDLKITAETKIRKLLGFTIPFQPI